MLVSQQVQEVEKLGGRHALGSLSQNNLSVDRRVKINSTIPIHCTEEEKKVYPCFNSEFNVLKYP